MKTNPIINPATDDTTMTVLPREDRKDAEIEMREDIEVDKEKILYNDEGEEDPNSPANILKRYPLLVGMTPEEREILNKRVRRRM